MINVNNLKPHICPVCGKEVREPIVIPIYLNDGSVMPQPACSVDAGHIASPGGQKELLDACKEVWIREILSSEQMNGAQKAHEILRVQKLEIRRE